MLRDPIDDFGGDPPGPGDKEPTIMPVVRETPTWSEGSQLTLNGSADVTTTVAIMIENAHELSLDRDGEWSLVARTNIFGGRMGSAGIDPFAIYQSIPILFGTQEVSTYGEDKQFTMTVDLISPLGEKYNYQVAGGALLTVSNLSLIHI